jgi:hypothetical protein
MIDGVRYESIRAAARATGRSRSNLQRDLRNPLKPNVSVLEFENEPFGTIPVFAQIGQDGKEGPILLFSSLKAVVEAGFATSTQMVRRRIQSENFSGWYYASVDDASLPIRKPYTPKPGEKTYEEWQKN